MRSAPRAFVFFRSTRPAQIECPGLAAAAPEYWPHWRNRWVGAPAWPKISLLSHPQKGWKHSIKWLAPRPTRSSRASPPFGCSVFSSSRRRHGGARGLDQVKLRALTVHLTEQAKTIERTSSRDAIGVCERRTHNNTVRLNIPEVGSSELCGAESRRVNQCFVGGLRQSANPSSPNFGCVKFHLAPFFLSKHPCVFFTPGGACD
jgi:hypothetical protein